ncbi:MAG: exodeoxyribonuclease VII small subunit [Candidatus Saccharimonas sp.]
MSKENKSIQEQLQKLQELVAWFDSDDFVLEQAIEKYHEAEVLAMRIDEQLVAVKNEITVLKEKFDA